MLLMFCRNEDLTKNLLEEAKKKRIPNVLKCHRSVGGIRASIYNAFPKKGVERFGNNPWKILKREQPIFLFVSRFSRGTK
jgi:phosphoserine aminotransferase